MNFLQLVSSYLDAHLAMVSGVAVVVLDIILRLIPKAVPVLELAGRACGLIGNILIKISGLFPNKTP